VSGADAAVRIRPAASSDLDAILAIEGASFAADERAEARTFRHGLRSPTVSLLVAVDPDRNEACGYANVERRRTSKVARLTSIAIAPDEAGRGVGRMLLEAAEAEAHRHGATSLRLEVRADNRPAQRLYERAGYERFAVIEDYYEDGTAAWRYEKALGAAGGSRAKRSTSRRSSTKARAP
jgi:ribosomal-protein-alanine acetyltransferase